MKTPQTLRTDALAIWQAGVHAVDSERLVRNAIQRDGNTLRVCGQLISLERVGRIAVVGAGKAGAGMAAGFESAVGEDLLGGRVTGWINVPEDCVRPMRALHLHGARPAGLNEPTAAGVAGADRILEIVRSLTENDVCLVLLSGGGSALLPAPVSGISLEDKQAVTRKLSHAGATIQELNCVRKHLSRIKGGRLAAATRAGTVITLIISDVIGDPLDIIASGPTVPDPSTPAKALAILERYRTEDSPFPEHVLRHLRDASAGNERSPQVPLHVRNHVIGNNAVALEAARLEALARGYHVHSLGSDQQGVAREVGRELALACKQVRERRGPISPPACLLSGGEPVVHLAPTDRPRKGGRNQELALAALKAMNCECSDGLAGVAIVSGGTDGEDGPTNAAGAIVDSFTAEQAANQGLEIDEYLSINNAYEFFARAGGLLITGPTHTNVMDLRVALIDSNDDAPVWERDAK